MCLRMACADLSSESTQGSNCCWFVHFIQQEKPYHRELHHQEKWKLQLRFQYYTVQNKYKWNDPRAGVEEKVGSISTCQGHCEQSVPQSLMLWNMTQKHEFLPPSLDYWPSNLLISPLCETGNTSQSFPSPLLKNGGPHSQSRLDFEECRYMCT